MKNPLNKDLSRRAFVGAAAVAGVGLAGCSSSSDDSGSSATEEASGTTGGGTITAGSAYAPSSYDPASTGSAVGLGANWHVLEGLYGTDYTDYSTFNELATGDPEWSDEYTCTVTIRDGACFSTGDAVTADDVVACYENTKASDTYAPFLNPFDSMTAVDDSTVQVVVNIANFSLIKERLSVIRVVPASMTADERTATPIGSGPWMYSVQSDTEIELVPNEYYNGDHPALDEMIHYDILTDSTARITAQQEGTTLVMENVTADAVDTLTAAGCTLDEIQGFGTRFIMFNPTKEPWNNVKARQAVMYALNVDNMISNTFAGYASACSCYLPETFTNYHEASTVYTYDPDTAAALLEEAGVTPGSIVIRTTDNTQAVGMGTQAENDLTDLGFTVEIRTDTSSATYAAIDEGDDDFDILIAPGDPSCFGADPDLLLNWWFGDNVWTQTRCPWQDTDEWQELNSLMTEALGAEGDEQQEIWNQCFDILAENVYLYPIVHIKTITAIWDDPSTSPTGTAIGNFEGIGTTSMNFIDSYTVTA